jgi:hypothetical protein
MRPLTDHKIEGIDNQININVLDEPGAGGACHEYLISATVLLREIELGTKEIKLCQISFQNGPVLEAGINGLTQEALITVCIDRLRCFQEGDFACDDNQDALSHLEAALTCLQKRTRTRLERGVEGRSML